MIVDLYERIRAHEHLENEDVKRIVGEECAAVRDITSRELEDIAKILIPVVDELYITAHRPTGENATRARLWLGKPEIIGAGHPDWSHNRDIALVRTADPDICCLNDCFKVVQGQQEIIDTPYAENNYCERTYMAKLK